MTSKGRHLGAQRPFQQAFLGKIGLRFPGTQSPVGAIHYSEGYIPSNRIHIWFGISGRNVPFGRRCLERQTSPSAATNFRHFLKTSVSRRSLLPAYGHALHRRGLYFHDVARTASRGATSLSGDVAWKDKPTLSAAINFRHSLKTSVSRRFTPSVFWTCPPPEGIVLL